MQTIDYSFFYKNSVRSLLLFKYVKLINSYGIPKISKFNYSFLISNILDTDDIQIYNYIYLFKYFFGYNCFLTRIKSTYYLGVWYYTLKVSMVITNNIYTNIYYLMSEFVIKADKTSLQSGIFNKNLKMFYIMIRDLNVFSEKKQI